MICLICLPFFEPTKPISPSPLDQHFIEVYSSNNCDLTSEQWNYGSHMELQPVLIGFKFQSNYLSGIEYHDIIVTLYDNLGFRSACPFRFMTMVIPIH